MRHPWFLYPILALSASIFLSRPSEKEVLKAQIVQKQDELAAYRASEKVRNDIAEILKTKRRMLEESK